MTELKWWQKAVFYQIYPRSFADGNGDGIGDFAGMISKLDYLKDLGVDAVWLSPHYPSPQFDCGYDIADYTDVEPEYGNLEDFTRFLVGLHARGMRLILDLVLNHTSHMHSWFLESRSSKDNPKRDWYIWKDGVNGGPPNNWYSTFGGSAWEYDEQTGQYYYHFFFKEQPDLNWRNPEVKQAMFDAVRFWLDLGVDGFRLDAIGTIFEVPEMTNHDVPYTQAELSRMWRSAKTDEEHKQMRKYFEAMFKMQVDQPGMHELMKELRQVVEEYEDRMLVAEDSDIAYMGNGSDEIDLVFNFPLMRTPGKLTPAHIRKNQQERLAELAAVSPDAWPCNTLGNHDSPRLFSRFGDGVHNAELARVNLALMLTLKGTPFLYNGEEIGMTDLMLEDISQFRDLLGVFYYNLMTKELGMPADEALKMANQSSRDKNRTPMQWANEPNAGFSPAGVTTWLPVNPNYAEGVNVADQMNDPGSMLTFYKTLLAVRKSTPALIEGEYVSLEDEAETHLVFLRRSSAQTCLVVLNYSAENRELDLSKAGKSARVVYSSEKPAGNSIALAGVRVSPFEIFIGEVE